MSKENLRRDEAAHRSGLITTHSYDVSLDLRDAPDPAVSGYPSSTTIDFDAAAAGTETFLDFISTEVRSVTLNGEDLDPADVADGCRIRLPGLRKHNRVTVVGTARYSRSGEGMHRFFDPADGRCYLYTQYEPADARRVFANFEQPDLKARFTFHVTAPAGWEVAANSAAAARTPVGTGPEAIRWDFETTLPMSTYITSVLAGPYYKAEDSWTATLRDGTQLVVPLALYCRASMAGDFDAPELFRLTRDGLGFFNDLFDYPYPWGKYDQAFVPEYNLGAMENPGLVTFTDNYVFTSRATDSQYQGRANTLMHEMSHMWFGDLVTMQWWDDLWLKESFADYMGTLGVDRATGWDTAWVNFANRRKAWAYVQDQLPTTHPIVADIPDLEAAKQNFDGITYAKGASVVKQLVAYVGFDAFIAGARRYFREHAYGNTTLKDLLAALGASSGRDLGDWSRQWLQTSGISVLAADIAADGGLFREVAIVQDAVDPVTSLPAPRPHRLRIGLYDADAAGMLVRTRTIEADISGRRTVIPELAGVAQPALLLVNDGDLTYAKVRLDPLSEQTVRASLDRLRDPMARALCWSALWDSTRDAVTPAGAYLDAVTRFGASENNVGVLLAVLDNASTAVERYASEARRPRLRADLAALAEARLQEAVPGSDHQLAWARALATAARHNPSALPLVRRLLGTEDTITGLTVDAELRWALLHALAAQGQAVEEELDAELERDMTASGRAGHATALAARPQPEVKAAAWRAAVEEHHLSNQLLSATITGFTTGGPELLEPFIAPYFDVIADVWEQRSIEIAGRIVRGLYPAGAGLMPGQDPVDHAVMQQTDSWLTEHATAPPALRRIVVEQRSHLLRALQAQARDA